MRTLSLWATAGLLSILISATSARSDLMWGVNGHPFTAYPGIPYREQLELVRELGMRSYRVNISFPSQAPMLAKLVAEAKPLGIEILPVLTPGLNLKAESAEQLYDRAYKITTALISQFKNEIRVWELGNELENFAIMQPCEMRDNGEQYNCSWGPAGGVSALDYYGPRWAKVSAVLKGMSDAATAIDPSIRKAMGTAGWGHVGAFERMHRDGIKWDISVWHMYGDDPEAAFKVLAKYNRPIWVTEFNNAYGSKRGENGQVIGLLKQMERLRELQGTYDIEAAHIYELLDEPYWAPSFEAYMGLVHLKKDVARRWTIGGPKPAYETVKRSIAGLPIDPPTEDTAARIAQSAGSDQAIPSVDRHGCNLELLAQAKQPVSAPDQIEYAYCLILGRRSEAQTKAAWVDFMSRNSSVRPVLMGMLASAEFASKYPIAELDKRAFTAFAYRLLLDRDPLEQELTQTVSNLQNGSWQPQDLAQAIINSAEFKTRHPVLATPN